MGRRTLMETDGYGRTLDACQNCGHVGPVPRFRVSVRPELLLPEIELGQQRCQGCARGVDGDARYCDSVLCRAAREAAAVQAVRVAAAAVEAPAAPAPAEPAPFARGPRVTAPRYREKPCEGRSGRCQKPFIPRGPRSKFGPCCKEA